MRKCANMNTLFIGRCSERLNSVGSTNAYLKQLNQNKHLPEGFTVVAKHQISGRGQFGNQWIDEDGKNLLISVLLRPVFLPARHSFVLSMSVCLALHDFFSGYCSRVQIKWPNDILINRKKVAGILIENQITGNHLQSSVIGVGLNINQQKAATPQATSLFEVLGTPVDLALAEKQLLEALEKRYLQLRNAHVFKNVQNDYLNKLYGYKQQVDVLENKQQRKASISDVNFEGFLELKNQDNTSAKYAFKEISFVL